MDTRIHDRAEISKAMKSRDSKVRKLAGEAREKINREQSNPFLKSAIESLINAKLNGRQDNARDVSEEIYKYTKHKDVPVSPNSYSFSIPNYDEIFHKNG